MTQNDDILTVASEDIYQVQTRAAGPIGQLPLTKEMLFESPSGDLFGLTQNAGMGWSPSEAGRKQFLILSTQGGIRATDGQPIALGYHTGHWEIGLLVQAAAKELRACGGIPFAAYCSDPCDGRTQGTVEIFDARRRRPRRRTRRANLNGAQSKCVVGVAFTSGDNASL